MIRFIAATAVAVLLPPTLQAQTPPAQPAAGVSVLMSALRPDTVLFPSGGPRIVILTAPGEGVAALRLSIPLREGPAEAGAGWILKELGLERMQTLARPVGAQVSASRTPWGIAYSVVGASADFEYLAYLLREAVTSPDVGAPDFQEALIRLRDESAKDLETPKGRVASELRGQIAPGIPPAAGTPGSVAAMDGARVREVWLRSHQSAAMTLVVSAPVVPEVVLAATRGMGAPVESAAGPLDAPTPSGPRLPRPQALRAWYGEAWQSMPAENPHGPVTAILLADAIRDGVQGFEISVELWELLDRWVLAVIGGGYGRNAAPMRQAVSASLLAVRDGLNGPGVDRAVAQVRRDLLVRSRTPAGLVTVVGRAMEATGDPQAASLHLEALRAITLASTRSFVESLLAGGPVTAEVRP